MNRSRWEVVRSLCTVIVLLLLFAAQMRYTGGRALGREGFAVFVAVFLLVVIMVAIRRRR